MCPQVEMREAQRVHRVDEELRPPRPDEFVERQHRRRTAMTIRAVERVAMCPRDCGPHRKRHCTQLVPIKQQLLRQRLEAVPRGESPKQLEVFRRPQVFAVQPESSRSTRRESSTRREPRPSCPAQTAVRSTRDRWGTRCAGGGVATAVASVPRRRRSAGAHRERPHALRTVSEPRCRRCRRWRYSGPVPSPRADVPGACARRRSLASVWILIRGSVQRASTSGRVVGRTVIHDDQLPVGECLMRARCRSPACSHAPLL